MKEKNDKKLVGFVGLPSEDVLAQYADCELIDLDNSYPNVPIVAGQFLPTNTCHIIKRVVSNALSMPLHAIIFDDSPGKCDMARMVAKLVADKVQAKVVIAPNKNMRGKGVPICDSTLEPLEKAQRILDSLTIAVKMEDVVYEPNPPAAVWGVPAADFNLYRLFPPGTRLLGWFRCLENRTPADEDLELQVFEEIPTVFFAQTFCHKNIIAKHLAEKYGGLYVDADGIITGAVKAKIEAFLKFNR